MDINGKQLDRLANDPEGRVMSVSWEEDEKLFYLTECCDNYFYVALTPQELIELGAELVVAGTQRLTREV